MGNKIATFAMGCFWGPEEMFSKTKGVTSTTVGYMGGTTKNPSYYEIHDNDTGHAEVIQVEFDPKKMSYEELLTIFWESHNPTTPNCQGPNIGNQYRSAIFFNSPEQQTAAEKSKAEIANSGKWKDPVVTEVTPASTFNKAEEYHQKFLEKNKGAVC